METAAMRTPAAARTTAKPRGGGAMTDCGDAHAGGGEDNGEAVGGGGDDGEVATMPSITRGTTATGVTIEGQGWR